MQSLMKNLVEMLRITTEFTEDYILEKFKEFRLLEQHKDVDFEGDVSNFPVTTQLPLLHQLETFIINGMDGQHLRD
ncbi:MAG: hypothetical protein PHT88_00340 [Candidatus Moranbacteria bacterium]|nr:hypothetical protein [Candidatus Moranbacteria bacterium]